MFLFNRPLAHPSKYLGVRQARETNASATLTGRKVKTKRKESTQWKKPYDMNFSSSRGIFMNVYIFCRRRTYRSESWRARGEGRRNSNRTKTECGKRHLISRQGPLEIGTNPRSFEAAQVGSKIAPLKAISQKLAAI